MNDENFESADYYIDTLFEPSNDYMKLFMLGKIQQSYNETFEGKLSGLLVLLLNLTPYDGDENNMISIVINDSHDICPSLFQIITLDNGKFCIQQLAEETHKKILMEIFNRDELPKVKNMIKSGKEMTLLLGPHQVVTYNFRD